MPLHAVISYIMERCNCQWERASQALHAALCEKQLQAVADKLIRDPDRPRHDSRSISTGPYPVPSKLWAGYPWPAFNRRSQPRGNAQFREQTANQGETGPVYSNPTIATADIDAWLGREGQTESRDIMPTYPTSGYMKAELCLNGHVITGDIQNEPEKTSKFCGECGAATVRNCPECDAPFRGDHVYNGQIHAWTTPPNYCYGCGAAFPWTVTRIAAAKEHATEIEGLDEDERQQLPGIIDDLASGARAPNSRSVASTASSKRLLRQSAVFSNG
jgi:hypothetical protein